MVYQDHQATQDHQGIMDQKETLVPQVFQDFQG